MTSTCWSPLLERRLAVAAPVRDFRAALDRPGEVRFLCEVKKASPSAGVLRADFDPVAIARTYERHGAACVSVLTDAPFFQGSLAFLPAVRAAVAVPLLRKDFLLDPYQLLEARVAGRQPLSGDPGPDDGDEQEGGPDEFGERPAGEIFARRPQHFMASASARTV